MADLITRMSAPEGGFVGTIYNLKDPSMPAENLEAMWEAYRDFSWEAAACAPGRGCRDRNTVSASALTMEERQDD
jgi:hypothetical protein